MTPRERKEQGVTVVELMVVVAILGIVGSVAAMVLAASQRVNQFALSESQSIDEVRTAAGRLQRDLRNAIAVSNCNPAGYCLQMYAQEPSGMLDRVRYRAVQSGGSAGPTTLYRDAACTATYSSCATSTPVVIKLVNQANGKALFTCVSSTTYPRIDVTLLASPLSSEGSGTLTIQSSARPRNVTTAFC